VTAAVPQLHIHTDVRLSKVASLRHNPCAALHIWDASAHFRTRIEVEVEILTGASVADICAVVPHPSRQSYGTAPAPEVPIADVLAYQKIPDAAAFAVLRCTVCALDVVHLGPRHGRARFTSEAGWAGQWLAP
jgi:pyridoxamine 5'-phosphate oxidase